LGDVSVPHVSASSALTQEGDLVVALVNPHAAQPIDVSIGVTGYDAGSAAGRVLTGDAMDAHNTFEAPDTVSPAELDVDLGEGGFEVSLPARSVSVVTLAKRQ
jgi:alpha-N-arabinofuranosidase